MDILNNHPPQDCGNIYAALFGLPLMCPTFSK